ncbi:serine/threonine protein kinase [Primorskyibacter sedentarius]|uniref:Serine/threonine protein kinase n=1 Tax=Primorskyibacter sedentarius TaxID=745311 RepID=A0A4V2ULT6_9RHOB|nr:bifunctional protein-serine/threonine kinase/phosphatase [Primorskyibacter sedentarius]TCS52249.1 serine/threonine protein kinase [Primorskyibacter sedentarius]
MAKDGFTPNALAVQLGQFSQAGLKGQRNQDFFGATVPDGSALRLKGVTVAIADGISPSPVSHEAAEIAVKSLMTDYYATTDAWGVQTAASNVISATNSWLYGLNRRSMPERAELGHICTLSALILKGHTAHILHVGDSRVWRITGSSLEPLTNDHVTPVPGSRPQLSRGLGLNQHIAVDYRELRVQPGDVFLLTTDGVHEYWQPKDVLTTIESASTLDDAAATIAEACRNAGSHDDLTVQIVRVEALPESEQLTDLVPDNLPLLPLPEPGTSLDGFRIVRKIHENNRSHIFLAIAPDGKKVALKMPASETKSDPAQLRRFLMEEWIARRLSSPHVLRAAEAPEQRSGLYVLTEFIEGQTLRQWMRDNPHPTIKEVRDLAHQMILGLRAFHRKDMLHQDFRPENLMIDSDGTVKIIDLGSTRVQGVEEGQARPDDAILGTLQYTAPEYFVGDPPGPYSDQFSLGVVIYEMLTGRLPYGADAARVSNRRDRARLRYRPAVDAENAVPYWIDDTLRRATHPLGHRRFTALSEMDRALTVPSPGSRSHARRPLAERDPVRFWQTISAVLFLIVLILLARL